MHEPLTTLPIEQAAINLAAPPRSARSSDLSDNGIMGSPACGRITWSRSVRQLSLSFSDIVPGEGSPVRIAAQAVSGIGLLGAGLILSAVKVGHRNGLAGFIAALRWITTGSGSR